MTIGRRADGRLCVRASHYEAQMLAPGDVGPLTVDPRLHDDGDGQPCAIAANNPNVMPLLPVELPAPAPLSARAEAAIAAFVLSNPDPEIRNMQERRHADSLAALVELRADWRELVASWRQGRGPSRDVMRLAYVELYQAELLHRVLWGNGPSEPEPVGHHLIDAAIDEQPPPHSEIGAQASPRWLSSSDDLIGPSRGISPATLAQLYEPQAGD